ncbi:hypothetical protein [Clostridium sp. BJN0013]|uniref:hypothetical protein n=1 Tax=Clostridium sp. BJN0013 TaxID=3236840 RepID=UPI0034C6DD27
MLPTDSEPPVIIPVVGQSLIAKEEGIGSVELSLLPLTSPLTQVVLSDRLMVILEAVCY